MQNVQNITHDQLRAENTHVASLALLTIILTGDIEPSAIPELEKAVADALPDHRYHLQSSDPDFRGAHGAACEAYRTVVYPRPEYAPYMIDIPIHDEV